jgi:hypothetical protein
MEFAYVSLMEANVIKTGLQIVGYGNNKLERSSQKKKEEFFISWYGCVAKVSVVLWNDSTIDIGSV